MRTNQTYHRLYTQCGPSRRPIVQIELILRLGCVLIKIDIIHPCTRTTVEYALTNSTGGIPALDKYCELLGSGQVGKEAGTVEPRILAGGSRKVEIAAAGDVGRQRCIGSIASQVTQCKQLQDGVGQYSGRRWGSQNQAREQDQRKN